MSLPTTSHGWSVQAINKDSFDGLVRRENLPVPQLGDYDVLVQIEAVSLNYRDLAIPKVSIALIVFIHSHYRLAANIL